MFSVDLNYSYQRHLRALVEFAQQEGKTIQFKFIAHPKASTIPKTRSLIQTN